MGFNCDEPTEKQPFPDAWCDDCELIRAAHAGWNEQSEKLTKIVLLCSGCYERARVRNTRPSVSLNDLASLRWKCSSCEQWHTGPCLDFGYASPHYWDENLQQVGSRAQSLLDLEEDCPPTFLDEDYCVIGNENFFVRGLIHLPIIGAGKSFCWGVWGSLSRESFETLLEMHENPRRVELAPMFSWLSNQISEYPDTLSLKMNAHVQEPGQRPHFMLERSDHPLSREYHYSIAPERVKEIMLKKLRDVH